MQFTLEPQHFDQLLWVAKTAPIRPPSPILSGVRISSLNGELTAETYDYTTHVKASVEATVIDGETILVPGKLLAEIVAALPKKTAQFSVKNGKLEVQCGASKFRLNTMESSEYPTPPTVGDYLGNVHADVLFPVLSRALTATSRDDALPLLTAIQLTASNGALEAISTDRYRLTASTLPWDGKDFELLVPGKAVHEATRALTGEITLHANDRIITFSTPLRTITVTITAGDYPPAKRLIPESCPTTAVVNGKELQDAVKRISIVAERGTAITLNFTETTVEVTAGNTTDAHATETLPLTQPLQGDPIKTSFNPAFLLDGLDTQPSQDTRLGFTHPNKPVTFTPNTPHCQYTYLLVPVRTLT